MAYERVIVFGPTGSVGSVVAQTAHSLGAHVALAVRDLNKPIRGLDSAAEQSGEYQRVKADFSDNDAVTAAVKQSQATSAFVYLNHATQDHQLSFFEALKAGGVKFVVFLSSFTIQEDISEVKPADIISFIHARAELSLTKVFGNSHVAVRAGSFATNTLREKSTIPNGHVKLFYSAAQADYITPDDIGRVAGTILVQGPKDGQQHVYVFGPRLISATEAYETIGRVLHGKPLTIEEIPDAEAATRQLVSLGIPPPIANYLTQLAEQRAKGTAPFGFDESLLAEARANMEKYTGRQAQEFADWVANNKDLYLE